MDVIATLALPLVLGAGMLCFVFASTDDPRTRKILVAVTIGSVILALEPFYLGLCGLAEGQSDLYQSRCEGGTPFLPLLGVPPLLAIGFAAARWRSASLIVVGMAIFLTAFIVPWALIVRA